MTRATIGRAAGKALIGLVAVLAVVVLCSGCEVDESKQPPRASFQGPAAYPMNITVDPDTGCQYLTQDRKGITPRIAADGKTHMGCKAGGAQ